MKSEPEIIAEMERLGATPALDFFGHKRSDLLEYLSFEAAMQHLKDGVTAEQWEEARAAVPPMEAAEKYMPFAWDKANHRRGLSAARSIDHMTAWLWLAGHEDLIERFRLNDYTLYGKPQLRAICKHFGWDWAQWDDGEWVVNDGSPPKTADQVLEVG